LKKRTKKLLSIKAASRPAVHANGKWIKVFCFVFFKKEMLPFLAHLRPVSRRISSWQTTAPDQPAPQTA
jgi:hypothetical protein